LKYNYLHKTKKKKSKKPLGAYSGGDIAVTESGRQHHRGYRGNLGQFT